MKLTAIGALFCACAAAAPPPIPNAYRLYKLCEAQDPQCMPIQRELVRQIIAVNPDCRYAPISDERLWTVFMQVTQRDPTILRFSALTVETQAFSIATNCVHALPAAVAAEVPQPRQRSFDEQLSDFIYGLASMQRECQRRASACAKVDDDVRELEANGWCLTAGRDPGKRTSWQKCAR